MAGVDPPSSNESTPDVAGSAAAPPDVVALVRDLMFASRITAEARQLGVSLRLLREPRHLAGAGGNRLIVDLNQEGAIGAARGWKRSTGGHVVGFVSHVDTATISRARSAGIDQVIARSGFITRMAELLAGVDP